MVSSPACGFRIRCGFAGGEYKYRARYIYGKTIKWWIDTHTHLEWSVVDDLLLQYMGTAMVWAYFWEGIVKWRYKWRLIHTFIISNVSISCSRYAFRHCSGAFLYLLRSILSHYTQIHCGFSFLFPSLRHRNFIHLWCAWCWGAIKFYMEWSENALG